MIKDEKMLKARIDGLNYLLEEIKELRLHYDDLRDDHFLLSTDFELIKSTKNVTKLKLSVSYFTQL